MDAEDGVMPTRRAPSRKDNSTAQSPVPILALTHGQTLWLLSEMGLHRGAGRSTFNYYIKSLRKLDIPFPRGKGQEFGHRHVKYTSEEVMELAIALLLRVYGILPDQVVAGLRDFRTRLHPIYRQAYAHAHEGTVQSAHLRTSTGETITLHGFYLDLNIRHERGRTITFGPPRTVSADEALRTYAEADEPARPYLPLNLSSIAERILLRAPNAPRFSRRWSRHKRTKQACA